MQETNASMAAPEALVKPADTQTARRGSPVVGGFIFVLTFILIGTLVAFGALPRLLQRQELAKHTQAQNAEAPSVSVVTAQPGPKTQEFTLPGSMQAIQDAPIYARVNGYIHARFVDIGSHVRAGQVLASIDTPELDEQVRAANSAVKQAQSNCENAGEVLTKAEADLKTAEANVQKAKTDLNYHTLEVGRYKRLAGLGAVSLEQSDTHVQEYEAAEANLKAMEATARSAKAAVSAAHASVHVAEAALGAATAQRNQYEATRSFKKVTALFDGVVTQRNVDAGALVTSGSNSTNTVLFEIAKTDLLRIFVYVPEQYVPLVHDGDKAKIGVQEYPGVNFIGTVSHIAGGLDPNSKTLQVEIHVPNANHKLLPGMYARVRFESPTHTRLAVVPATAVRTRADGCFIYTVDEQSRAHLHKVEIGRDLGGQFEIAGGINAGDTAVVNPSDDIHDGITVRPVRQAVNEKPDNK